MRKIVYSLLLSSSLLIFTPVEALAVMQSLNGLTIQDQTFANDSNITITSSGNTHALNWNGLLPISRGGTGSSFFTNGSIPFISNGIFSENNSGLYWDNVNQRLGIGTNTPTAPLTIKGVGTSGSIGLQIQDTFLDNTPKSGLIVGARAVNSSLPFTILGTYDNNANERGIYIGGGGWGLPDATDIAFFTGPNTETPDQGKYRMLIMSNGNIELNGDNRMSTFFLDAVNDRVGINTYGSSFGGSLNVMSRDSDKRSLVVQGRSGQTANLQEWKKFGGEPDPLNVLSSVNASGNLTLGNSAFPGCLVLADSDGVGVTYLTANDGVLTASTTKPSVCQ